MKKVSKAEKTDALINSLQSNKASRDNQERHLSAMVNCLMGAENNINCHTKSFQKSLC
jgi:hypothetical protein